MDKKNITIYDIAREAQVSPATKALSPAKSSLWGKGRP